MTYDEALDFFARYGNVACDTDRLRNSVATDMQLSRATIRATQPPHDQPPEVALAAKNAVLDFYATLEEPTDPSAVREATVNRMIEFWERGETYTFPYTRAEVKAAERRWVDEERICATAPKRVPWAGEKR
jgi:hypothetical protein